jgi:hypothetical protein
MAKCKFFARVEPDSFWKMKSLTMRPLAELVYKAFKQQRFHQVFQGFPHFFQQSYFRIAVCHTRAGTRIWTHWF